MLLVRESTQPPVTAGAIAAVAGQAVVLNGLGASGSGMHDMSPRLEILVPHPSPATPTALSCSPVAASLGLQD